MPFCVQYVLLFIHFHSISKDINKNIKQIFKCYKINPHNYREKIITKRLHQERLETEMYMTE